MMDVPAHVRARLEAFQAVIADPPAVHTLGGGTMGLWQADREMYDALLRRVGPDARTLETGAGLSTVVFALCGARHTAVTLGTAEEERLRSWAARVGFDLSAVDVVTGRSSNVLPGWDEDLDAFLIDGNHGFPGPILDWFHGGRHLRVGGLLVVDDRQLPAVATLAHHLDGDPRWEGVDGSEKWTMYRLTEAHHLDEEWIAQPWLRPSLWERTRYLGRRAIRRIRRAGK